MGGSPRPRAGAAGAQQKKQKVENPGFDPGASSLLTTHSTD